MHFSLTESIALLTRTPATLRALLAGLPDEWTAAAESPESWSPTQVVAHLIQADQSNWIPRARIFLADGDRALPAFNPAANLDHLAARGLHVLLTDFEQVRAASLRELVSWAVTDEQLERSAVHPEFGVVLLRQLLATWTVHDLSHLAQITRVMACRYRDAVGPWSHYLRVLRS